MQIVILHTGLGLRGQEIRGKRRIPNGDTRIYTPEHFYIHVFREVSPEIFYEVSPDIFHEVSPEIFHEVSPDIFHEVSPEIFHEVSPEIFHEVSPEIFHEVSPEIFHEVSPEIFHEVSPEILTKIIYTVHCAYRNYSYGGQTFPKCRGDVCTMLKLFKSLGGRGREHLEGERPL